MRGFEKLKVTQLVQDLIGVAGSKHSHQAINIDYYGPEDVNLAFFKIYSDHR